MKKPKQKNRQRQARARTHQPTPNPISQDELDRQEDARLALRCASHTATLNRRRSKGTLEFYEDPNSPLTKK